MKRSRSAAKTSGIVPEGVCEMAHWKPVDDILTAANVAQDLVNKIGGEDRIKRFQSGELVLVERNAVLATVSPEGFDNGGVTFEKTILNVEAFLDDQAKYFREVFNLGLPGRKKLGLPKTRPGFGWGVVRVPGLSAQRMFDVLIPRFNGKTWKWCQNIDEVLDSKKEARTTDRGAYGVWCRARREADEEHKNRSANDLTSLGINCMTESERIALEGWFHWKTGSHLDIKNVTLSKGSRCTDGNVPSANWRSDDGFCMDRYYVDYRYDYLRAREVVSL